MIDKQALIDAGVEPDLVALLIETVASIQEGGDRIRKIAAAEADKLRGPPGEGVTITVFTDEAAFNAAVPGPLEWVVLTDAQA